MMSSRFTKITRMDQEKLSLRKRIWKHLVRGLQSKLSFLDRSTRRHSSSLTVNHACFLRDHQYHHHYHHHYRYSYLDHHHQQQCDGCKMEALKGSDGDDDHKHDDDDDQDGHGDHDHDQDHEKGSNNTPSTCSSNIGTVKVQHLNGVDAEAEKFIDNFYKKLSLERQQSTEEYFAMLARGS